ncbi:hypothetical protein BH11PLA2_BH11PLA2_27730 [soil metagenome]
MFKGEFAMAFMLLTTPPGVTEPPPDLAKWSVIQSSVQQLAMDWEILDPRETKYILAKPEEYAIDINLLRRRYQDLKEVPRLAEAHRLPDRQTANDLIQFNRAFRKTLDTRRALETDRADEWLIVIQETDKLYHVWDAVRDARCDFYYVTVRRQALRKVKESIGDDAWDTASLPPGVPTWRFAEEK